MEVDDIKQLIFIFKTCQNAQLVVSWYFMAAWAWLSLLVAVGTEHDENVVPARYIISISIDLRLVYKPILNLTIDHYSPRKDLILISLACRPLTVFSGFMVDNLLGCQIGKHRLTFGETSPSRSTRETFITRRPVKSSSLEGRWLRSSWQRWSWDISDMRHRADNHSYFLGAPSSI
jgi:hypothetical protein